MPDFSSKVVRSVKGSGSVRTTVPEAVAAILGLEEGGSVVWRVEPGSGRVWVSKGAPETARKKARGN